MFWQKIKSAAQWLIRKIIAALRWVGIKLGILASSPVTNETKRFIPGRTFPYRKLPWDILSNIRTFLHPRDFASNNQVLGHLLYPREELEKKLKESKESAGEYPISSAIQTTPTLAIVAEEKKVEANNYSQLRRFIVGNKLTQLLNSVEHADYEQVEKIIANDPALMFGHVNYKFRNGSHECTSPLKCAFKLYDTYMWKIFYKRIRREANPDLEQEYVKRYIKQMQEQTTHIDLEPLFEAYTEYERQYQRWQHNEIMDEKLDEELFKLGTVQKRMLPVHMLKELSREEHNTWGVSSSFDVNITPRPANCRLFDYIDNIWRSLSFTLSDPGWGFSFSLVRGAGRDVPLRASYAAHRMPRIV